MIVGGPIQGRPYGVSHEKSHGIYEMLLCFWNKILKMSCGFLSQKEAANFFIGGEAMIGAGWQCEQVSFFDKYADPVIFRIPYVKIARAI